MRKHLADDMKTIQKYINPKFPLSNPLYVSSYKLGDLWNTWHPFSLGIGDLEDVDLFLYQKLSLHNVYKQELNDHISAFYKLKAELNKCIIEKRNDTLEEMKQRNSNKESEPVSQRSLEIFCLDSIYLVTTSASKVLADLHQLIDGS